MLSVETRINGCLVGCAYVHNEFSINDKETEGVYYVEYHRFDREPKVTEFRIKHKREEGAEKLLLLIYKELDKRLKKVNTPKKA
jgi:hypothetical protein